jgi:hypothetical protein
MRNYIDLPIVKSVAAGSDFVVECPIGMTYDQILLIQGGTSFTRAHISNLQIKINGKPQREYADLDELKAENDYWGRVADEDNYNTIWFERPELENKADRRRFALGTAGDPKSGRRIISTLTINGKVSADAESPTLKVKAVLSPPRVPGLITQVRSFSSGTNVTGDYEISNLPMEPVSRIFAAHFTAETDDNISAMQLKVNFNEAITAEKAELENLQKKYGRVPQTNTVHFDPVLQGIPSESLILEGVSDLRFVLTMSSADTVKQKVEYAIPILAA